MPESNDGLAAALIAAAAAVIFLLGLVHLAYTFRGRRLHPRDAGLEARMRDTPLVITRRTTMWKAWIGFNASHSLGAIFFGATYGYLPLAHREVLLRSAFLLCVGFLLLVAYALLSQRYFFRAPLRWVLVATALYASGVIAALV